MRLGPVVLSLVIAAGGTAGARKRYRPPPPPPPTIDVGAELGAAIRARSASRVAKLLGDPVQNYGIWFGDAACAKQFGAPGVVTGIELPAFTRCLAQLKLQATTRQPGATGNALLTYEPGIELEISHSNGRVRWIGFEQQTEADRGRPTLTAQAFEALRKSGKTNLDDIVGDKLESVLERAKLSSVSAWMKLCIDAQGALDLVALRQSDAPPGQVQQKVSTAFEVAMRSWRFRPFQAGGKPMAVCTMTLLTYPAGRAPLVETLPAAVQPGFSIDRPRKDLVQPAQIERKGGGDDDESYVEGEEGGVIVGVVGGVVGAPPPPPPPPPPPLLPPAPPQNVAPTTLETYRTGGNKTIVPSDVTKIEIRRSGKDMVVGSFKLCLDAQGAIATVTQLKSTGFSAYDAKIVSEMKQWTYKPFFVGGKPVPVCTAVTFIYSQSPPPPPPPRRKP